MKLSLLYLPKVFFKEDNHIVFRVVVWRPFHWSYIRQIHKGQKEAIMGELKGVAGTWHAPT